MQVRHAREEAKRERAAVSTGIFGSNSSQMSSTTDVRGIHEAVQNIYLELKALGMDMRAANLRGIRDTSPVDGVSASRPPQPTQTRKGITF